MHIIVASTSFSMNIFASAVPDLKAIFGPSFFNLKAIVSCNIGKAAILSAIIKTKSPENTTVTHCISTNHTVSERHGTYSRRTARRQLKKAISSLFPSGMIANDVALDVGVNFKNVGVLSIESSLFHLFHYTF